MSGLGKDASSNAEAIAAECSLAHDDGFGQIGSDMASSQVMHPHHLVAPGVDDLDGDTFVLTNVERQALRAGKGFKGLWVDGAAEGFGEFLPGGFVGEEGLADAEGAAVVVGIQEPSGDFAGLGGFDAVFHWIVILLW